MVIISTRLEHTRMKAVSPVSIVLVLNASRLAILAFCAISTSSSAESSAFVTNVVDAIRFFCRTSLDAKIPCQQLFLVSPLQSPTVRLRLRSVFGVRSSLPAKSGSRKSRSTCLSFLLNQLQGHGL